ncbi:MAG: anthranilate synthase component I [Burkholderiaceae bacterium]|nr:anthranilate synthase component I [Burkholderiaceae bacterium]
MTEIEFRALAAQGYNRIPLLAECLADLDTPLSLYLKLTDAEHRTNSLLLESVVGGERFGRYSFIGLPARIAVRSFGERIEVVRDGEVIETSQGDPIAFVREFKQRFRAAVRPGLPRFSGGLAGYFGYDVVRFIEPRLGASTKPDPIGTPDMLFLVIDELAIVDNLQGKLYLIVYADPQQPEAYAHATKRLRDLTRRLRGPAVEPVEHVAASETEVIREFDKSDYLAAVARAKEYIIEGDMMQVQVGQCLRKPFPYSPLSLYRALRSINPSPYMYYYDFGDFHVVGASPEILVRQEAIGADEAGTEAGAKAIRDAGGIGQRVTIRPLAGTRKRGMTPQADLALAEELLADPKERAEHLMLIDLARNDIGRIAVTGSVRVTDQMAIEKYSHVQHIVSNVEGVLEPGMDAIDVLRASFPAGTLTGAPKVRAMEIIDELEISKRGIYGGACGYLSYTGDMDVAIAIRTGVVRDGQLFVQAAAGIVYDSIPENEWQETEVKARAVIRAAELVESGFARSGIQ